MEVVTEKYKNTEVGVIPWDWEVKSIKEIAPLQRGFDLPNRELTKGIYPVVYSNGIVNYHNKFQAKSPGIVTGRSGTIGKVTYVEENYWPHNTALWVTNFNNNNPKFIYYLFLKIKLEQFASGSGVPTLNRNDVHDFRVGIPTLAEQTAIATALSDTDALISSLEKLIAKKRNMKQGAMQELLTGKKRLSEFQIKSGYKQTEVGMIPQDWEIYSVRDLIEILTDYDANGSFSSVAENVNVYDYEEYAWYVRSTDLENNTSLNKVRFVDKPSYKFLKKTALYGGELLFLKRGDIGNVYLFEMKTEKATVAPNLYLLKLNQISNSKYLYYYFTSKVGQLQLKSKNASSTLGALYKDDVKSIVVPLPTTKAEQTHIATVLSDMDMEISVLEGKLEKYRGVKMGMMQNLLTGCLVLK